MNAILYVNLIVHRYRDETRRIEPVIDSYMQKYTSIFYEYLYLMSYQRDEASFLCVN